MDKVKEAMGNLEIAGLWPASEAARKLWRELMLAVHYESCCKKRDNNGTSRVNRWSRCGDGYYCERAKAIQELGV